MILSLFSSPYLPVTEALDRRALQMLRTGVTQINAESCQQIADTYDSAYIAGWVAVRTRYIDELQISRIFSAR